MKSKEYEEGRFNYIKGLTEEVEDNPYQIFSQEQIDFDQGWIDAYMDFNNDYQYTTKDPDHCLIGRPLPAVTTMLIKVCGNNSEKFDEAMRLVDLFVKEAIKQNENS